MKNIYEIHSPEWQLFENVLAARLAATAFDQDSERYRVKAMQERDRATKYLEALKKLDPKNEFE